MASEVDDEAGAGSPLVANGAADVRRRRDQAKAMLSKQAVKIATKAEEHERFIFKVISLLPPPLTIPFLPFLCKSCCHLNKSCRALAFIYRKLRDCCLVSP
jgi:hypothetical protein